MQSLREPSQSESYHSKFEVLVHNWDSTPGPVYVCVSTQSEHIRKGFQQSSNDSNDHFFWCKNTEKSMKCEAELMVSKVTG